MEVTKDLVQRCYDLNYDALPADVVDRVKYLVLDFIGVAARGALSESSGPVQRFILNLDGDRKGAVVIGTLLKASPSYAALANGTAAHSLELDDVVNEASLHPAVAIMPAALAACTPATESSKTRQLAGSTPSLLAVVKKTAGSGLPRSSSSAECTTPNARSRASRASTVSIKTRGEEEASASSRPASRARSTVS